MYDVLIRNGRVVDPAQGIDGNLDVAVRDGKIVEISNHLSAQSSHDVFDAEGTIVTPGLIDMHCHVVETAGTFTVAPDIAGVEQGVTTVVDGGSAGQATFPAFAKYILPTARTRVFCFLSLSSTGQAVVPELNGWEEVDPEAIAATVESHRGLIRGIKVRLVGTLMAAAGAEVARKAKGIARSLNLPLMVHIGDSTGEVPQTVTREVLSLMEKGDVVSHVYTARNGGILDRRGTVLSELKDAVGRGAILDVAHGMSNCSFDIARKAMDQGILPTTISSDLSASSVTKIAFGLTTTLSKFMALGLSLGQVVEMATINPARALGEEKTIGTLKAGADADISIVELISGTWRLEDSEREAIEAHQLIAPVMTIRPGRSIPCGAAGPRSIRAQAGSVRQPRNNKSGAKEEAT
jgi:dihydroorotase